MIAVSQDEELYVHPAVFMTGTEDKRQKKKKVVHTFAVVARTRGDKQMNLDSSGNNECTAEFLQ